MVNITSVFKYAHKLQNFLQEKAADEYELLNRLFI